MRTTTRFISLLSLFSLACSSTSDRELGEARNALDDIPVIPSQADTPVLDAYDEAPRNIDSDDPAIWVHPTQPGRSLVLGALKEAGMQVYDLQGRVVQTIIPLNSPPVTAEDPPTVGPQPHPGTTPCPDSESGETFGRYNNVDVQYGVEIFNPAGNKRRVDLAVVPDRGCDRIRFFIIDPDDEDGPLHEVTSPSAPRVFPQQFVQPSPYQPSDDPPAGVSDSALDDEATAYGLTTYRPRGARNLEAFVTQASRSVIAQFEIVPLSDGTISYQKIREFRFPVTFDVPVPDDPDATTIWTPCREEANEDPQLEGLVVDQEQRILYAGHEPIGVWRIDLNVPMPALVNVPPDQLIERTTTFGAPYWAIPDDDEFECEEPDGDPPEDAIVVAGNPDVGGDNLEPDVEGLAIYYRANGAGYLLISSQGDDTFHVYDRQMPTSHISVFQVEGTGETDGHELVNVPLGRSFPRGLFVVQNGEAPEPENTDPINGFEYDGSNHFKLVDWGDIADALGLVVDTTGFNPRSP